MCNVLPSGHAWRERLLPLLVPNGFVGSGRLTMMSTTEFLKVAIGMIAHIHRRWLHYQLRVYIDASYLGLDILPFHIIRFKSL